MPVAAVVALVEQAVVPVPPWVRRKGAQWSRVARPVRHKVPPIATNISIRSATAIVMAMVPLDWFRGVLTVV